MDAVKDLHIWKRICSTAPTLEELLNPIEESTKEEIRYKSPEGDAEIIASVRAGDNKQETEEEEQEEEVKEVTKPQKAQELCDCMEQLCLEYSKTASGVSVLGLQGQLEKISHPFLLS